MPIKIHGQCQETGASARRLRAGKGGFDGCDLPLSHDLRSVGRGKDILLHRLGARSFHPAFQFPTKLLRIKLLRSC